MEEDLWSFRGRGINKWLWGEKFNTGVTQDESSDTDKLKRADAKISYLEYKLEFKKSSRC